MVLLPEKEKRKKEGKKVHILKKFIPYYSPYKVVFFLDLICAAEISLIDLAYPQILRIMTKTIFAGSSSVILKALLPIGLAMLVMYIIQGLCKYYVSYQGHMMGANMERDMRQQLFNGGLYFLCLSGGVRRGRKTVVDGGVTSFFYRRKCLFPLSKTRAFCRARAPRTPFGWF